MAALDSFSRSSADRTPERSTPLFDQLMFEMDKGETAFFNSAPKFKPEPQTLDFGAATGVAAFDMKSPYSATAMKAADEMFDQKLAA